ncbi:MAG: hypothetical protein PHW24_05000 [Candidatus Moranbacteria bacterium]|nr:hypothetical protein [Candidatus Moranbacteria bacterium]
MTGQIFTESEKGINNILQGFKEEYGFRESEIYWRVVEVKERTLVCIFHEKIAKLIEEKFATRNSNQEKITVAHTPIKKWIVNISSNGYESTFLLGLLSEINIDLKNNKAKKIADNKMHIQNVLDDYKSRKDVPAFASKVYYRKKVYYVSLKINGEKRFLSGGSPEKMKQEISEKLTATLREMLHEKMLKNEVQRAMKSIGIEIPVCIEIKTGHDKFSLFVKFKDFKMELHGTGSLALCEKIRDNIPAFIMMLK